MLAHPATHRILAQARGSAYTLWLEPADYREALATGAETVKRWSDGTVTDLGEVVGEGWIWGRWDDEHEPAWLLRAFEVSA